MPSLPTHTGAHGLPQSLCPFLSTLSKPTDNVPEDDLDIVDASDPVIMRDLTGHALPRDSVPTTGVERRHLLVCHIAATGKTDKEIAEIVGLHPTTVRDILKQPESMAFVAEQMAYICHGGLEKLIKEDAIFALQQLRQLLIDALAAKKLDIARRIIKDMADRHLGLPTSRVEHTQIDPDKISDEELLRIATGQN